MTAADGRFSFTVTPSSDSLVMLIKKSGFASNAKDVPIKAGSATEITVEIFPDQASTTFSASTGTTLSLSNSASAVIPANGLQTTNGVAYTGIVNVGASYFGPDTVDGVRAFPAPYLGTDTGVQSPLVSAGIMEVKLTDAAGNPLQLKSGSTAILTYPANSVSAGASTIPMWYYDEANKIWVRDGQASKQSNGTYQASVTHFTIWNADFKGVTATIHGCLQDALGQPVSTAGLMRVRGSGWTSFPLGYTPTTDGTFTVVRVPAGMPLELYSQTQPAAFTTVAIPALAPGEVRQLACVVVTNPPASSTIIVPPPSTVFATSAGSFAGAYSGTYSGSETGTFSITVSPSGSITGSALSTTYPGLVSQVSGAVGASGSVAMAASGQAGSANYLGTITGAGLVSGTWTYTGGPIGNGTFAGQRN